jgi:uncharacterized membrane protein
MDFMNSWAFIITMLVLLIALIGLMIFLQKRQKDED